MSVYTTELRFICERNAGLEKSDGQMNVEQIIEHAAPSIFNQFPIYDENYRLPLEKKILMHFYTREICEETVGLWKLRLHSKMNEIMPYYNQLYESTLINFNPMYTTKMDTTHKNTATTDRNKTLDSNETTNFTGNIVDDGSTVTKNSDTKKDIQKSSSTSHSSGTDTNDADNWNLISDTPQGSLNNVKTGKYLSQATNETIDQVQTNESTENGSIDSTIDSTDNFNGDIKNKNTKDTKNQNIVDKMDDENEKIKTIDDYIENVAGYSGKSGSQLLAEFRETFLNIDLMIIEELEELFMQIW